jgi:hypothetical protein
MRLLRSGTLMAAWAAGLLVPSLAQAGFEAAGPEAARLGHLRGDQTRPQVAISYEEGYVVWQDNATDGQGLGIRAQRLDAGLTPVGRSFRVNVVPTGDQENPQVARLRNGGAMFVWQGGPRTAQRIYARVLAANGTFMSGDIPVNTFAGGSQRDPVAATLADGSVLVAWASWEQDGSLQGIYAQRLAATGGKLGSEFRVNVTTAYNQRSPAVAALTNGNFVVAWISELQRGPASVDVFARMFDATGTAVTGEFAVNDTTNKPCANPSVAAALLGNGFAVAYSQDDNERLGVGNAMGVPVTGAVTARSSRGWDVMIRLYGTTGTAITGVQTINQTTSGDQYAPVLRGFGADYATVWTSMGQDGSREGVFGQIIRGDGTYVGSEFQVNSTTVSRQLEPALASDDHARLLSVWSSFHGDGAGFDLFTQEFAASEVIPLHLVTNALPPIIEPNSGLPRLDIPVEPTMGEPLANAFVVGAGTYNGLFFEKSGISVASAGAVSLKTTSKGTYSGKLLLAGKSHAFRGTFDESGWAASVIKRSGLTPVTVYLQFDLVKGEVLQGGVSDGDWWADLRADRQVYNKTTLPTARAGSYTVMFEGEDGPAGDSFGTFTVDAAGVVKYNGVMADGSKFKQTTTLARGGTFPLYGNLHRGGALVLGWIKLDADPSEDVEGDAVWARSAGLSDGLFPSGFNLGLEVEGSRYVPPVTGQKSLNLNEAQIILTAANLADPLVAGFQLGANNVVTPTLGLKLQFSGKDGRFKGTLLNPASGLPLSFQGVVVQRSNRGFGNFMSGGASGRVELRAP